MLLYNWADGCKKGTCARKPWKVLFRRVTSQQKSKLEILENKKYIIVHLSKWNWLSKHVMWCILKKKSRNCYYSLLFFHLLYIYQSYRYLQNIKGVEFHLANAIFLNDGFTAKISFTKVTDETFYSTLQYVNFTNAPLATRVINKWSRPRIRLMNSFNQVK